MSYPAAGHFSIITSDPDQAEQIYHQSIVDAKILKVSEQEKFRLNLDYLNFNQVSLVSSTITSRCRMGASVCDNDFKLVLALHAPTKFYWRGESYTVSNKQGLIVKPGSKVEVERYSRSKTLVINTTYSVLKSHLQLLINDTVDDPLIFPTDVDLTQGPGAYLYELMSRLSYDVVYNNRLVNEPGIKRGYGELIMGAILALPHNYSRKLKTEDTALQVPQIVSQAEEYIRSHYNEPLSISNLTSQCGCSRKVLFSSFKSSRDYTPMEYLREQRLQAVRRKFGESEIPSGSVSEIAYECGFTHLGRFSEQYRQRFGELPSETFKRDPRNI